MPNMQTANVIRFDETLEDVRKKFVERMQIFIDVQSAAAWI
jgi:hypothetical protein